MTSVASSTSTKTKGIVALILGIVSVVFAWFLAIVGLIAGIVGLVFGILSRRSEPGARSFSLWGTILSSLGIVLSIVSMILGAILITNAINGA